MRFPNEDKQPNEQIREFYIHALDLQAAFDDYHVIMDRNRDWVRQRLTPSEDTNGRKLITIKTARALAIVIQCRSFYERANAKIEVPQNANTSKEDARTTKLEKFLGGVKDIVASRSGFVYSDALWHGLEAGAFGLLTLFNPWLAANRQFPFEITAIDPRAWAWEESNIGLVAASRVENRPAGAVYQELRRLYDRSADNARAWRFTEHLPDLAKRSPTTSVEVLQFFDRKYHALWIDGEFYFSKRHFMGRCPLDVGYIYDIPSDRPEERGKGLIAPIADMIQDEQMLFDTFATDAELGNRPLVLVKNGNKWQVEQVSPGEVYSGEAVQFANYNPNHQLLQQLAQMLNDQIDITALPRAAFSGPQFQLSGFALTQFMSPIQARLDDLKKYPELTFGEHYKLILQSVRRFATPEMAKQLASDATENYANSFAVLTDLGRDAKGKAWLAVDSEDVTEHDQVRVSLSANLPSDTAAKTQSFGLAVDKGLPFEYAARYILQVENYAELEQMRTDELLEKTNPMWAEYVMWKRLRDKLDAEPETRRDFFKWLVENGYIQDPNAPPAPQDLRFQPLMQPQLGAGQMPFPSPMQPGGPMPEGVGMNGMAPPAMFGQGPSIAPEMAGQMPGSLPVQLGG